MTGDDRLTAVVLASEQRDGFTSAQYRARVPGLTRNQAGGDLRHLVRVGVLVRSWDEQRRCSVWRLPSPPEVDYSDDAIGFLVHQVMTP